MIAPNSRSIWFPVVLACAALAWRVAKLGLGVDDPVPNFSPWLALAFAGSVVMPRVVAWWVWPALLVSVDVLLGTGQISQMWTVYACYALAGLAGGMMRGRLGGLGVLGGTVASAILFYVITSTQAWYLNPAFAKTASGWLQALTVGDPTYQPQAWVFGLRSVLSEGIFATILVVTFNGEAMMRKLSGLSWGWSRSGQPAVA